MLARSHKRRRSSSELKFNAEQQRRRRIGDAAVVRGVEVEFDRTLPFWRCYADLRLRTGVKPEVVERHTQLLCRLPCKVFKRVDVVWARTQVHMRVSERGSNRGRTEKTNGVQKTSEKNKLSFETDEHYTIDTLHFVHDDAYKKGPGSEHSFHVQSVVLRDAPAVLQCVAGAMVSFSFLVYTSLRLINACESRKLNVQQLGKEIERSAQVILAASSEPDNVSQNLSCSSSHCPTPTAAALCSSTYPTESLLNTLLHGVVKNEGVEESIQQLRSWCPPSSSRVLILGMGGNSMALALRTVLGPAALLDVVEVEPAVVAACVEVGTLNKDDPNMVVHLQDADACLRTLPGGVYDMIFMDIFEPMGATMKNLHPWVVAAREKLTPGGLLVMNEHQLPSAEGLAPYVRLFGDGNVQAVNLRGWNESVVVCVAPGHAETDTYSLQISKTHTNLAFNIYEALMPGWLPHFSWLVVAKTHQFEGFRSRLWTS